MVDGPMARNAPDAALMLDAMSGAHPEDPLSLEAPAESFWDAVSSAALPRRVAYSPDLGLLPVDREVAAICAKAAEALGRAGVAVADACPDLSGALDVFQTLRAALFAADKGELLETHRDALKPEIVWNIEKGLALDADRIARAERARGAIYQRCVRFFERHELLLCPCVIVPPFDVDTRWIDEIDGHRFDNYVDWLGLTFVLTLTACPSASVPVGFTAAGLPVGLQIPGPAARRGGGAAGGGGDRGGDSPRGRHAHRPARRRRRDAACRLRPAGTITPPVGSDGDTPPQPHRGDQPVVPPQEGQERNSVAPFPRSYQGILPRELFQPHPREAAHLYLRPDKLHHCQVHDSTFRCEP